MRLLARRGHRSTSSVSGYTILEISVSAALLGVMSVGSIAFFRGTMDSMHETVSVAQEANARGAGLDLLQRDLQRTDPEHLRIDTSDPEGDILELQVIIGMDTGGPIWGAHVPGCKIDGGKKPGWSMRYQVDDGEFVRVFLDEAGRETEYEEVLVRGLAVDGSRKSLSITRPDPTNAPMLLSIEAQAATKEGTAYKSTELSTSVRIGGTGSEVMRVEELGTKLPTRT
ncbi:MAG: hypothetical protein IPN34_14190 [Planctomycetes bacterium]|nr:hypothetical protein [Planctomycetota bacterium]